MSDDPQHRLSALRAERRAQANGHALRVDHLAADLSRRTVHGGATAVIAQFSRILLQLALAAVLSRLLNPADFGLIAMATTLMGFVGIFTDLGLSAATIQQREISQSQVTAMFYLNLAVGLLVMVIAMAAAPLIAWLFGDQRIMAVAFALALSIPVAAAGAQHSALLQRGMRWGPLQWMPLAAQLAGGITAALLAWKGGAGYWALVAQSWVTALATTASVWWFCAWRPDLRTDFRDVRGALNFGLNLTGFNLVNYFHRQFDNVLIGWRWGATDLGYYTRAYQLLTLPLTLVNGPVGSAIMPALSRLQDDPERWRRAFLKAFGAVNLVSASITAVMISTAQPLIRLLFGPGWDEAGHIFAFLSISMFASTPMNTVGWIYMSLGQTRRMLRWGLVAVPFYMISYLIGLPYGASGVALCYSVAITIAFVPCLAYAAAIAPIRLGELLRRSLPPAVTGALTAAFGYWVGSVAGCADPAVSFVVICGATAIPFLLIASGLLWFDPCYDELRFDLMKYVNSFPSGSPFRRNMVQSPGEADKNVR